MPTSRSQMNTAPHASRTSSDAAAAAASLACLHALRTAGATRAVVYPRGDPAYPVPRRLYAALGFRPVARTVTYRRSG